MAKHTTLEERKLMIDDQIGKLLSLINSYRAHLNNSLKKSCR